MTRAESDFALPLQTFRYRTVLPVLPALLLLGIFAATAAIPAPQYQDICP